MATLHAAAASQAGRREGGRKHLADTMPWLGEQGTTVLQDSYRDPFLLPVTTTSSHDPNSGRSSCSTAPHQLMFHACNYSKKDNLKHIYSGIDTTLRRTKHKQKIPVPFTRLPNLIFFFKYLLSLPFQLSLSLSSTRARTHTHTPTHVLNESNSKSYFHVSQSICIHPL